MFLTGAVVLCRGQFAVLVLCVTSTALESIRSRNPLGKEFVATPATEWFGRSSAATVPTLVCHVEDVGLANHPDKLNDQRYLPRSSRPSKPGIASTSSV
jgi:hypothetical protein